jgi:uncharacterized membrane protein
MKAAVIVLLFLSVAACGRQPSYPEPQRIGNDVVVDIGTLSPDVPRFFTYHYAGKKINFFVIRVDQKTLGFLDACARCYPAKKGYRFEQGELVCRECSMRFPVQGIEQGVGSCVPIRIEGSVRDGRYTIPVSLLEKAAGKF